MVTTEEMHLPVVNRAYNALLMKYVIGTVQPANDSTYSLFAKAWNVLRMHHFRTCKYDK